VAEDVVWEKLRMLSEGAALATVHLFSYQLRCYTEMYYLEK
jgi:hypothetical protein